MNGSGMRGPGAEVAGALVELLHAASVNGVAPGYSLVVADRAGLLLELWGGAAELRPRPRPVVDEQPFDVASLTKVLLTTPLALAFWAQGALDLDAPLRELLADAPAGVTARHCLQHTSGLPAWRPLWSALAPAPNPDPRTDPTAGRGGLPWGGAAARARMFGLAMRAPLESAPGTRHCYSDLGMLLLGAALEACGKDRLDRLWETHVRSQTRADLRFGWPGAAATEECPQRGRVLAGEVHDLNAAAMGGIASHAGLFGSAQAVIDAARAALRLFDGDGAPSAVAAQRAAWTTAGLGSHRLGWDSPSGASSSAGPLWPGDGVGHLGFTGTSLWIAPRQGLMCALLTNRVHPVIEGGAVPDAPLHPRAAAFRALRPAVHHEVVRMAQRLGRWRD